MNGECAKIEAFNFPHPNRRDYLFAQFLFDTAVSNLALSEGIVLTECCSVLWRGSIVNFGEHA